MAKFEICGIKNEQKCSFFFDTKTNIITDSNNNEVIPQYYNHNWDYTKNFTRGYNPYKKGTVNWLLEIVLGFNCNFHCNYCSQNLVRGTQYSGSPKDVKPFIEKLKKSRLDCHQIQLWGGEPLVYWKTIERLIPELRKLYPSVSICMTSNGSLLTLDKVKFLLRYRVALFVSHDGYNNHGRPKDVLDDSAVVEAIKYYINHDNDNFAFATTPNHNGTNVIEIANYFKNRLQYDNYRVNLGVHNIVRCHVSRDVNQVLACKLTEQDLQTYQQSIYQALNAYDKNFYGLKSLIKKKNWLIDSIIARNRIETVRAECKIPFSDGLITDLKGNILICHNHAGIDNKILGQLDDLENVNPLGYNCWMNKQRCIDCLCIHGCKGGCPSADDRANELACPNLYALYYGLYRSVFTTLLGIYVNEIKRMQ